MFKRFKDVIRIFRRETKSVAEMTRLQRLVVTYSQGFIGRKSRKYYLKSHGAESIQFERQEVKDALARLQKV